MLHQWNWVEPLHSTLLGFKYICNDQACFITCVLKLQNEVGSIFHFWSSSRDWLQMILKLMWFDSSCVGWHAQNSNVMMFDCSHFECLDWIQSPMIVSILSQWILSHSNAQSKCEVKAPSLVFSQHLRCSSSARSHQVFVYFWTNQVDCFLKNILFED